MVGDPTKHKGKNVRLSGVVVQIMSDSNNDVIQCRFALGSDLEKSILVAYPRNSSVKEGAYVNIDGTFSGMYDIGGGAKAPTVIADAIKVLDYITK